MAAAGVGAAGGDGTIVVAGADAVVIIPRVAGALVGDGMAQGCARVDEALAAEVAGSGLVQLIASIS